ncbi:phosphotransferase family protein [Brevirhabdus sp.]|uniref:phosphotransferase family protein n=1 Tax=Brevirhabdus sp. TaxID=2004514 RepID=UPI0040585D84
MTRHRPSDPPFGLKRAAAPYCPSLPWRALPGGRTNQVWQVGDLICKLYEPAGTTPLFPNDATAEAAALAHLGATGLAPRLVARLNTPAGQALIYRAVDGSVLPHATPGLATALGRLHALKAPAGLRQLPTGAEALLRQGDAMLRDLGGRDHAALARLRPRPLARDDAEGGVAVCMIHGDPVPANAIATDGRVVLIDWQCPALGDPAEDLALALSPAMQQLYGAGPKEGGIGAGSIAETFLRSYPARDVVARYHRLAAFFHWRTAAYCLWKAARGDAQYLAAHRQEMRALKALAQLRPATAASP